MPDDVVPILSFRFEGGDADEGLLNFYDASRFQYGAARFVYTLEHFRQTGRALNRISERINVDYRVPAARQGSWIMDVLHVAGPPLAEMVIKVPIDAMIAHVFAQLRPNSKIADTIIRLEEQRTAQERERTRQARAQARLAQEQVAAIREQTRTTQQALRLVERMLNERPDPEARQQLEEVQREALANGERDALLEQYRQELENIPERSLERLVNRAQSQIVEIGKPLIRSASGLEISGHTRGQRFAHLDRRIITELGGNSIDALPTSLVGSVVRYDKESGWGKFRNPDFAAPISFLVPAAKKNQLTLEVIDAMKQEEVEVVFYYVRDRRRVVKYLIFDNIID